MSSNSNFEDHSNSTRDATPVLPFLPDPPANDIYNDNDNIDETNLRAALERSLGEHNPPPSISRRQTSLGHPANRNSQGTVEYAYRHNMDDIFLRLSNDFVPLLEPAWDTLIYIGPPVRSPGQSEADYTYIKSHFGRPYRIQSAKLRQLQSTKLDALLRPNASIRAEKRLKKLGILKDVDFNAKYHLDLRPPNEDEEAIILLTDLTCTQGVLTWHLALNKYALTRTLVLGTDEYNTRSNPYFESPKQPVPITTGDQTANDQKSEKTDHKKGGKDTGARKPPNQPTEPPTQSCLPSIPEYLPMRHNAAIERLLQAVHGHDPKIDSAPKMWTYFAIAKYFDCAQNSTINHWIGRWIYHKTNSNFIQNNPEVAYRIGMGIESADLVRDAFSILVGERALSMVNREESCEVVPKDQSVHGRKYENLDDDEWNRIDHAASSLVRRIHELFDSIVVHMTWLRESSEYQRLDNVLPATAAEHENLTYCKGVIRDYVRGKILSTLVHDLRTPFSDHDRLPKDTAAFRRGVAPAFEDTYNDLQCDSRKFTRTFWLGLQRNHFDMGTSNTSLSGILELKHNVEKLRNIVDQHYVDPYRGIRTIGHAALNQAIEAINRIISIRDEVGKKQQRIGLFNVTPNAYPNVPASQRPAQLGHRDEELSSSDASPWQSPKRGSEGPQTSTSPVGKRRRTLELDDARDLPVRLAPRGKPSTKAEEGDHGRLVPDVAHHDSPLEKAADPVEAPVEQSDVSIDWELDEKLREPLPGISTASTAPIVVPRLADNEGSPTRPSFGARIRDLWTSTFLPRPDAQAGELRVTNMESKGYVETVDPESGLPVWRLAPGRVVPQLPTAHAEATPRPIAVVGDSILEAAISTEDDIWGDEPSPFPHNAKGSPSQSNSKRPPQPSQPASKFTTPSKHENDRFGAVRTRYDPKPVYDFHDAAQLLSELSSILSRRCEELVNPPHLYHSETRVPIDLIDHLVCLEEDEWKYLPLWAGGCDDGSGGVFDEADVPNLEAGGFRGGKRGISRSSRAHRNDNIDCDQSTVSGTDSSFDDVASEAISTVGKASKAATDGTRTIKSLSDTGSEAEFLNQDEIYEQIQAMKMEEAKKGKRRADHVAVGLNGVEIPDIDGNDEDSDEGDASTIMGATSDVQGEMFHDLDDDDDGDNSDLKDGGNGSDMDLDDVEIINKDDL